MTKNDLAGLQKRIDNAERRVRTAQRLIGKTTLAISDFTDPASPYWFDDQAQHQLNTMLIAGLKMWKWQLAKEREAMDKAKSLIDYNYSGGA